MARLDKSKRVESGFIAGGVVILLAVSGYFVGLRQTTSSLSMTRPVEVAEPDSGTDKTGATNVPVAVTYIEQNWSARGANAGWQSDFAAYLKTPPSAAPAHPPAATAENKLAALQARGERRAYDGAPPVVPHPIAQDSSASCLVCHGEGLQVKDRFASKMSHASFGGSCTQCHLSARPPLGGAEAAALAAPLTANIFLGRDAPGSGSRAWAGAPPTIPHRTLMRTDCMSCHGPGALFALRTPHPERQSCVQCHVPSATEDQHLFIQASTLGSTPLPAEFTRPPAPPTPPTPPPAPTPETPVPSVPPAAPSPTPEPAPPVSPTPPLPTPVEP